MSGIELFSLEGKNVLLTGAGGAIGTVLAESFAQSGANVGLIDLDAAKLAAVAEHVRAHQRTAWTYTADVSSVEGCRAVVDAARSEMGRIDVLVNCAGINRRKPIDDVTAEDFDAIVAVNMRAVFFISQAIHPAMQAQGGGVIVNISSLSARYSYNTISVYAATKAAVTSMTRSFAHEWVKDNIRVNCIEPAVVQTEFTKPLWGEDHRWRYFAERMPIGRLAKPEELVGAVLYLASDASTYTTGQAITIEGGLLAGGVRRCIGCEIQHCANE